MAQRLATEYVKATLTLTEYQMHQFLHAAEDPRVQHRVKVLENGGQEVVLEDMTGEEVHLPFELKDGFYVCEMSCRLINQDLTKMVRKLFVTFKGHGIVHRIYNGFTMVYLYNSGAVCKIVEKTKEGSKLVFEYKNTVGELERLYQAQDVEKEISTIYEEINGLLDQRNRTVNVAEIEQIDLQLRVKSNRFFMLEV